MAGSKFKVELNLSKVENTINNLSTFNMATLLDNVGSLVETQSQDRFESKTDVEGKQWQEWSPKYKKSERGIDILRNTQRLFGSINYQVKGNKVEVGSNVEYSAVHNYGYEKQNIPKRSFLGISKDNEQDIDNLVAVYIEDLMNG